MGVALIMKNILVYLFLIVSLSCNDEEFLINDYRLFRNSPVADVAEAIRNQDMKVMSREIIEHKTNLDFQESKYGATLLMLTVINEDFEACKLLLEAGADPNLHDTFDGASAILYAASIRNPATLEFLKLLLSFGANPSDIEFGQRRPSNSTRNTPLILACQTINRSPIKAVDILVQAGADIDYTNEYKVSALRTALTFEHYDVVLYLLHKGAEFNRIMSRNDGRDWYLWDKLKLGLFPIGSKKHKEKMLIVDFLRQKGVDYDTVQVPPYAVKEAKRIYPSSWEDYLKKY